MAKKIVLAVVHHASCDRSVRLTGCHFCQRSVEMFQHAIHIRYVKPCASFERTSERYSGRAESRLPINMI